MLRTVIAPLAAVAALAFTACGSDDKAGAPTVSPEAAKTKIEQAAHVRLAAEPVPDDARGEGLAASYSNAGTAVKDGQIVALFVLDDAGVAGEIAEQVRASAPKSAQLIVNDEVMVVYAAAREDRAGAVERAVKAL